MKKVRVVVIGGGSPLWSPLFARDFTDNRLLEGTIVLYDLNLEAAKMAQRLYQMYNDDGRWTIEVAKTLEGALEGAECVIFTINAYGMAGTRIDLEVPAKYGITQTVGDTVGAGGMSRAIRNIPAIAKVSEAMSRICPQAWLINCSNPMTVLCMAAEAVIPGQVIGYCHEWQYIEQYLRGLGLAKGKRLRPLIFGLNHFSAAFGLYEGDEEHGWSSVLKEAIDLLPALTMTDEEYGVMNPFANHRQLTRELAGQWGVLQIAGDRHVVEFLRCDFDYLDQLRRLLIKVTTLDDRDAGAAKSREQYQRWLDEVDPLPQGHSLEEVDHIVAALAGEGDYETNLVVPLSGSFKVGLLDKLHLGDACPWEISCRISGNSVISVADMSSVVLERVSSRAYPDLLYEHQLCVSVHHGVFARDPKFVAHALRSDPSTRYQLVRSGRSAEQLAGELIDANCRLMGVESWA